MPVFYEAMIQIRHKSLILFDQPHFYGERNKSVLEKLRLQIMQDKQKAYSGTMTDGAKKRLSKSIDIMCQMIKTQRFYSPVSMKIITHRLSFITLTISSQVNVTAKEAYSKAFKHFLQWLRRTMKVNTYVWKCEVQKRGQIHYHITTPSYIHYQNIRDKWNELQQSAGWLVEYFKEHGHYNPNSTDIKEVRKVRNLSSYLIKEFTKSIQNPDTEGKIWDCSRNLKKFGYYKTPEQPNNTTLLSNLIEQNKIDAIPLEKCIVIRTRGQPLTEYLNLHQIQCYDNYINSIRSFTKK